jgi:site-specific DNA recombinase
VILANPVLVRLLARAHLIRERMFNNRNLTLDDIAASEGIGGGYTTRLFRISLLAPSIISAVLSGRQPQELNARRLLEDTRFPLDWNEQRQRLGFEVAS